MAIAVVLAVLPLFLILGSLVVQGASSLSLGFFTNRPAPVGETGGGVAHAITGTLMIVGMASLVGVPIGIGTAHQSAKIIQPPWYLHGVCGPAPAGRALRRQSIRSARRGEE